MYQDFAGNQVDVAISEKSSTCHTKGEYRKTTNCPSVLCYGPGFVFQGTKSHGNSNCCESFALAWKLAWFLRNEVPGLPLPFIQQKTCCHHYNYLQLALPL